MLRDMELCWCPPAAGLPPRPSAVSSGPGPLCPRRLVKLQAASFPSDPTCLTLSAGVLQAGGPGVEGVRRETVHLSVQLCTRAAQGVRLGAG